MLPHPLYSILKSYLINRVFQVRYKKNTLHYITYNLGYPKGASSVPYCIPSSQQTYLSQI